MERFRQTQAVEWKCNFGVWTLLAGAIYFVAQHPINIRSCIALVILSVFVILHGCWLYKIHQSEQFDKVLWVRYRKEALRLLHGDSGVYEDETKSKRSFRDEATWLLMEVGITLLLCALLLSVLIVANNISNPPVDQLLR
jgi:hypothetical protein